MCGVAVWPVSKVENLPFNLRTCVIMRLLWWYDLCSWRKQKKNRQFVSSSVPSLSFFLSTPLWQIIVLPAALLLHQPFALWSSSNPGMLWLCCVRPHCPALRGVAPFSANQPPSLSSCYQKEERTSCFNIILSIALVALLALGLLSVTLTCPVDQHSGLLNSKRSTHSQTCQHSGYPDHLLWICLVC